MLRWRHDYFSHQHNIYLFWVPQTSHLIVLQVKQVDVIFGGKRYSNCFLVWNEMYWVPTWKIRNSEFWNWNSYLTFFQQRNSKKKSDRNLRNQKRNQNSASNGDPRNWNQKSEFLTKCTSLCHQICRVHSTKGQHDGCIVGSSIDRVVVDGDYWLPRMAEWGADWGGQICRSRVTFGCTGGAWVPLMAARQDAKRKVVAGGGIVISWLIENGVSTPAKRSSVESSYDSTFRELQLTILFFLSS
jgi:hypothetical protein